jgi:hypothetical protein
MPAPPYGSAVAPVGAYLGGAGGDALSGYVCYGRKILNNVEMIHTNFFERATGPSFILTIEM